MEENKKEETKETQKKKKLWEMIPVRSCMLMSLGGLYILYMGYRLCKNVINGVDGGGIGFFIVGAVFLIVGAGMLYVGIRGVLADDKKQKAEAAALSALRGGCRRKRQRKQKNFLKQKSRRRKWQTQRKGRKQQGKCP